MSWGGGQNQGVCCPGADIRGANVQHSPLSSRAACYWSNEHLWSIIYGRKAPPFPSLRAFCRLDSSASSSPGLLLHAHLQCCQCHFEYKPRFVSPKNPEKVHTKTQIAHMNNTYECDTPGKQTVCFAKNPQLRRNLERAKKASRGNGAHRVVMVNRYRRQVFFGCWSKSARHLPSKLRQRNVSIAYACSNESLKIHDNRRNEMCMCQLHLKDERTDGKTERRH